ncbi:MAG: DHH family phosphoesterase [Thermoplasmatota archaeon]
MASRLLLHHWDTDGICSAAMLYTGSEDIRTPSIGNYALTEEEIQDIKENDYDEIVVVDLALHAESLQTLAAMTDVTVYDHHVTEQVPTVTYHNPILTGADGEEYPSASVVVAEVLDREDSLLAMLGAVGDWEERLKDIPFYRHVEAFMQRHDLAFEDLHRMTRLIDANYKAGDRAAVEQAVVDIAGADDVASFILENEDWRRKRKSIRQEIQAALDAPAEKLGPLTVKRLDTPYNIISTVTRQLWDGECYVMVVNCGFFDEQCQLYVRGSDCRPLIKQAKEHGYVAGGKQHVLGAIVPQDEIDVFTEEIIEIIKKQGGKND